MYTRTKNKKTGQEGMALWLNFLGKPRVVFEGSTKLNDPKDCVQSAVSLRFNK